MYNLTTLHSTLTRGQPSRAQSRPCPESQYHRIWLEIPDNWESQVPVAFQGLIDFGLEVGVIL